MTDLNYAYLEYPGNLYFENMSLSTKILNIQRKVYDIFGVWGDFGGIMTVIIAIANVIVLPFNMVHFRLTAIRKLITIKKKEKLLNLGLF